MKLPPGTTSLSPRLPMSPRKGKYSNTRFYRTPAGEIVGEDYPGPKVKAFDSKRELKRWQVLAAMEKAGRISGLRTQVRFDLHALGGEKICIYRADFVYIEAGQRVVEDCKGAKTRAYLQKRKWMKAEHGIEIRET